MSLYKYNKKLTISKLASLVICFPFALGSLFYAQNSIANVSKYEQNLSKHKHIVNQSRVSSTKNITSDDSQDSYSINTVKLVETKNSDLTFDSTNVLNDLYRGINDSYFNSFRASTYQEIKSNEIKQKFLANMPKSDGKTYDYQQIPLTVTADNLEITNQGKKIIYTGNVLVSQGDRKIRANQVVYLQDNQGNEYLLVDSDTSISSNQFLVKSSNLYLNKENYSFTVNHPEFYLVDSILHGNADKISGNQDQINLEQINLWAGEDTSLTLNIKGDEATYHSKDKYLEFKNTVFRIGKFPLIWLPNFKLSTDPYKQHGFLDPNIDFSSAGQLSLRIPYFWRFNNNFYYVLKPTYSTKFGLLLDNSLTYLSKYGQSQADFIFAPKWTTSDKYGNRWYLHLGHTHKTSNDINIKIDFNQMSDKMFLSDFYDLQADYLQSTYLISKSASNYDWKIAAYKFENIYDKKKAFIQCSSRIKL